MDTKGSSYADPRAITNQINQYVTKIINYSGVNVKKTNFKLMPGDIESKVLKIYVPMAMKSGQRKALQEAVRDVPNTENIQLIIRRMK